MPTTETSKTKQAKTPPAGGVKQTTQREMQQFLKEFNSKEKGPTDQAKADQKNTPISVESSGDAETAVSNVSYTQHKKRKYQLERINETRAILDQQEADMLNSEENDTLKPTKAEREASPKPE